MKTYRGFSTVWALAAALFMLSIPFSSEAQVVSPNAKKRLTIGVGLFTDIWRNKPAGLETRAINQGVQVFGTYNMPFGKSNFSFAAGLGITVRNLYWNQRFQGDSLSYQFVKIADTLDYKRSKLTLPYLEIPVEFRLLTNNKIGAAIGFKAGYMMYAHAKWVGDDYLFGSPNTLKASFKGIRNIERFTFGPTARFGYKWFHVNAYYSLSSIFNNGKGPEIAPVSVGFLLMPF